MQTFGALEWDPEALQIDDLSNPEMQSYYNTYENEKIYQTEAELSPIEGEEDAKVTPSENPNEQQPASAAEFDGDKAAEEDEDKENKQQERERKAAKNSNSTAKKRKSS
jgi:hypothetical protein